MPDRASFLLTAETIGGRLCGEALWSGDRCNWLGDALEFVDGDWKVVHRACGVSLYDGTSGIALFLARLYRATGDRLLRVTARAALRHAFAHVASLPATGRLGLYSGIAGVGYAAVEAGTALDEDEWVARGRELLATLTIGMDDGKGLDVISGAAGTIPLLLHLGGNDAHMLAIALGERLLRHASHHASGAMSWDTMPTTSGRHLTGYSHGTAGIALALLELGIATGDARFLSAASAGVAYERHHYIPEHENWPDFRAALDAASPTSAHDVPTGVACAMAWCHGAPGIGLARLRTYHLTRDETARAEAEVALRTTGRALAQVVETNPMDLSPCHGASGMAELFLSAAKVFGDSAGDAMARRLGMFGIERIAVPRLPWPCGVPGGEETPALLTGLAGIGHFYLRLAIVEEVPSVLLIEGDSLPPANSSP